MTTFFRFLLLLLLTLAALLLNQPPPVAAVQNYSGLSAFDCDEPAPSPAFLYTCNGLNASCQSFLIFRSTPTYNSPHQISHLTSSDAAEIAHLNGVHNGPSSEFISDKDVIVPISCSCSGNTSNYYQSNTSFTLTTSQVTYFVVATETFEGLASCSAVKQANPWPDLQLSPGIEIQVPLRCACPTKDQISTGVNYLLTYPVSSDDSLSDLATRFNATEESILEANTLTRNGNENPNLVPGTTILIPLSGFPQISMTRIHKQVLGNGAPPADVYSPGRIKKRSKKHISELAGVGAACFLLLVSVTVAVAFFIQGKTRRRKKKNRDVGEMRKEIRAKEDLRFGLASCERVLKVYGINEVKEATGNFSGKNRIKGSVYRGEFDGKVMGVKKMSRDADISQEVNILMKVNHFNVIKLHGICDDGQCFYLVSEYMELGCLKDWLRNEKMGEGARWETRIRIALDVANGLHYLHNFTEPAYVHKDIKSSNVLLNRNLRAKITNFSLARAAVRDSALTPRLIGTRGYLAPEYLETGEVTPKVDVYAFGVVLLELITGKEAVLGRGNDKETSLLSTTMVSLMEKGDLERDWSLYVDSSPEDKGGMEEVGLALFRVSLCCLRKEAETRPSMEEIVSSLVKILTDLKTPKLT